MILAIAGAQFVEDLSNTGTAAARRMWVVMIAPAMHWTSAICWCSSNWLLRIGSGACQMTPSTRYIIIFVDEVRLFFGDKKDWHGSIWQHSLVYNCRTCLSLDSKFKVTAKCRSGAVKTKGVVPKGAGLSWTGVSCSYHKSDLSTSQMCTAPKHHNRPLSIGLFLYLSDMSKQLLHQISIEKSS